MTAASVFETANAHALAFGLPLRWYPNGRRYGQSLRIGNLSGDKGESLWICLRTGAWKDHATGDSGGDLISLYAAREGISQSQALRILSDGAPQTRTPVPASAVIPPPSHEPDDLAKIALARQVWEEGLAIAGTPAEKYLQGRNLAICPDMPLKFHPACLRGQERHPAMLALMTDAQTNEACGVHRTFIKPDGSGKAEFKPAKMMLGRARNAVIRLTPDEDVTHGLGIVEGIENGLAILGIGWAPVWAALSSGGIANFPVLLGIEALTIFADHDTAGQEAAQKCARRWAQAGKEVTIRTPSKQGADWNDAVLEVML